MLADLLVGRARRRDHVGAGRRAARRSARGRRLVMTPLLAEPGSPRLFYRITMGVRQGEDVWKRELNALIRELQPEIDAILRELRRAARQRHGHGAEAAPRHEARRGGWRWRSALAAAGGRRRARARRLPRRALPRAGARDACGRGRRRRRRRLRALVVGRRAPSSTCCRGREKPREPAGGHDLDRPAARLDPGGDLAAEHRLPGARPGAARLLPRRARGRDRRRPHPAAARSSARPTAGCPGTRPSARSSMGTPGSSGIRTAPTAGSGRAARSSRSSRSVGEGGCEQKAKKDGSATHSASKPRAGLPQVVN